MGHIVLSLVGIKPRTLSAVESGEITAARAKQADEYYVTFYSKIVASQTVPGTSH